MLLSCTAPTNTVGLAFLLCIACLAESVPALNDFLQLAPYPTKAARVTMLRLLLWNIALSYFAEYFSTFCFRRDIWRARHERSVAAHPSPLSAADEEERLLSEESGQNLAIVTLIACAICHFSIQILK